MITALLCGVGEPNGVTAGRNMIPVLGRPLLTYPLLAARHAHSVEYMAISTNSRAMADLAKALGAELIWRPDELTGATVDMGDVFRHAVEAIERTTGREVTLLVILLANAPAVTAQMIDQAVEILIHDPGFDSVATVARHNEYNPARACYVAPTGEVASLLAPPLFPPETHRSRDALGDVYFMDNCLRVLRRCCLFDHAGTGRLPYPWMGARTAPLVHEGAFDVDYDWQIPGVERWLVRQGFSSAQTPYGSTPRITAGAPIAPGERRPATGRVLVTTVPFGEIAPQPVQLLEDHGLAYTINPIGRRLREEELIELVGDYEALIAGTEPITAQVIARAPNLQLIARVGIGLDNVDLQAARARGIAVTYTPDAPSAAVAELTIAQMLAALRHTHAADRGLRAGAWRRHTGRRLGELTVGVIGVGRIGRRVIRHLHGWETVRILANDLIEDQDLARMLNFTWASKAQIYREADIITLHVPATPATRQMIGEHEFALMRDDVILINTARGGVVSEPALVDVLREKPLMVACVDVFEQEPYSGPLVSLDNCLLTCHMGSTTRDCRLRMEVEATEEVVRYFRGQALASVVPESEYA